MYAVKITAVRKADYKDLQALYENPIDHTCDVCEGQVWVAEEGQKPADMCDSAWESMRPFVEALARGEGNFYDGLPESSVLRNSRELYQALSQGHFSLFLKNSLLALCQKAAGLV